MIRSLALMSGFLLLANVVLLLWPDGSENVGHIYAPQVEINPHFIKLNKEIEDRFYGKNQSDDQLPTRFTSEDEPKDRLACFRLGPFIHNTNYELAQAVLFNVEVDFTKSKRFAKGSNVYRVYLGPFKSKAEVADVRLQIKRKKVLDHFVRNNGEGSYIVSLGIYSTKTSADSAVELFKEKLEGVKLAQEKIVMPDSFWLHFRLKENQNLYRQLGSMSWGEQSAKLIKHPCLNASLTLTKSTAI